MSLPRIYFDSNDSPDTPDRRYGLWLDASKADLARIPGGPQEAMQVVIYMTGELEMGAILAFDGEWGWTAKPIPGTAKYLDTPQVPTDRAKLFWLIELYLSGHHDVGTFCKEFEHTYNLEIDRSKLTVDEQAVFGDLFNKVVVFSPFEKELKAVPFYKSATEIKAAVIAARSQLGLS